MITQSTLTRQVEIDTFIDLMQQAGELQAVADKINQTKGKVHAAYNSSYCTKGALHENTVMLFNLYTSAADAWNEAQSRADSKRTLARSYAR